MGRHRYIAFRVEGAEVGRAPFIEALREASQGLPEASRPRLVSLEKGLGLVRCPHTAKEETVRLLQAIRRVGGASVRVRTLGTSGTIRAARRKHLEGDRGPGSPATR